MPPAKLPLPPPPPVAVVVVAAAAAYSIYGLHRQGMWKKMLQMLASFLKKNETTNVGVPLSVGHTTLSTGITNYMFVTFCDIFSV